MLNGDSLLVDIPAVGERIGEYPTTTIKKEERKKEKKKNLTFRYESPFAPPGNKNDVSVSVLLILPERIPLIRGAFSLCLFILLTSYASRFLFTFFRHNINCCISETGRNTYLDELGRKYNLPVKKRELLVTGELCVIGSIIPRAISGVVYL